MFKKAGTFLKALFLLFSIHSKTENRGFLPAIYRLANRFKLLKPTLVVYIDMQNGRIFKNS